MTIKISIKNESASATPEVFVQTQAVMKQILSGQEELRVAAEVKLGPGEARDFYIWSGQTIRVVEKA